MSIWLTVKREDFDRFCELVVSTGYKLEAMPINGMITKKINGELRDRDFIYNQDDLNSAKSIGILVISEDAVIFSKMSFTLILTAPPAMYYVKDF